MSKVIDLGSYGTDNASHALSSAAQPFPTSFRYALVSLWLRHCAGGFTLTCAAPGSSVHGIRIVATGGLISVMIGNGSNNAAGSYGGPSGNGFTYTGCQVFEPYSWSMTDDPFNLVVAIDAVGQIIQCYIDRWQMPPAASGSEWLAAVPIAGTLSCAIQGYTDESGAHGCLEACYVAHTASFFDLSDYFNGEMFFGQGSDAIGDASGPTGGLPEIFILAYDTDAAPAILSNRGTGVGFVTQAASPLQFCYEPPPATLTAFRISHLEVDGVRRSLVPIVPKVSLIWSDDRGETWRNPIEQSLGMLGEYATNVQFQRLGMGRDRVFALLWAIDAEVSLLGAFLNIQVLGT